MNCSKRLHLDVAPQMTSPEAALRAFQDLWLGTARNDRQLDVPISARKAESSDERKLQEGEAAPAAND